MSKGCEQVVVESAVAVTGLVRTVETGQGLQLVDHGVTLGRGGTCEWMVLRARHLDSVPVPARSSPSGTGDGRRGLQPGPATDAEVPAYWQALGLPGLADIHVHFLPPSVLAKVWAYFDAAKENYGLAWPVHYRNDEADRLDTVRRLGLRAVPSL